MYRVPVGATRGFRWGFLSLLTIAAMLAATVDDADARGKRKRGYAKRPAAVAQSTSPKHASIVVDAKTGATLHESSPDALRHPASLTKIMTLYLLFERLETGKIKLHTTMPVSEEAAAQAPTKLGVRPGQTLLVEDAIKALVTKSANDASVVIAEALGGSEEEFARQMTRKARALGMSKTVYRNASGLPDMAQVTTAREQALLGIAIQERFPRYYRYFSTSSFVYGGKAMRNHNKLLGRVQGVDGIKTGYTNASGFNLVTSMHRGDRDIVAVVMGGATGGQRDAKMRSLIEGHIMEASAKRTATTKFAEAAETPTPTAAPVPVPAPPKMRLATAQSAPAPAESTATIAAPRRGSTEPIKPVPVKTVVVKLAAANATPVSVPAPAPAAKPAPIQTAALAPIAAEAKADPAPQGARPGILGVLPAAVAAAGNAVIPSAKAADVKSADVPRHLPRGTWAIQIGAFEAEGEAKQRLSAAQTKVGGVLKKADPYTERTSKGEKTYYRARFAGFDRDQAEAACKQLKRSDIACMALKI